MNLRYEGTQIIEQLLQCLAQCQKPRKKLESCSPDRQDSIQEMSAQRVPLVTLRDSFSNAAHVRCKHASSNVTVLCMTPRTPMLGVNAKTKHRKHLYAILLTM